MRENQLVFWFEGLGQKHNDLVGKKGANLGEMVKLGMLVAPGFAISLDDCRSFLAQSGTAEEMSRFMDSFGEITDVGRCEAHYHDCL